MHIGSSSKLAMTTPDAPIDVLITLQPMTIVQAAADLVWSRVLKEFPNIKIALSEGGIGWVPYFLDRIERTYDMHHHWTGQDLGDLTPTERFLQNVLLCFISDPVGLRLVDRIGSRERQLGDGLPALRFVRGPPGPRTSLATSRAAGLSDADIDNITHRTAMRWFDYDPFQHIARGGGDRRRAPQAGRGPRHRHPFDGPGPHRSPRHSTSRELSKTATGR